jgi:hypothetical protein
MPWFQHPLLIAAVLLASAACKPSETKYDVYLRGAQVEGEARRGPCKLAYDEGQATNVISGDQIQTCLARLNEALALFERALAMDPDDVQFQQSVARVEQHRERLAGMLKVVRGMERDGQARRAR